MLTDENLTKQRKHAKLRGFYLCKSTWLGIECLVKTFNRGEDEKIDLDEINELFVEDDKKEPSL